MLVYRSVGDAHNCMVIRVRISTQSTCSRGLASKLVPQFLGLPSSCKSDKNSDTFSNHTCGTCFFVVASPPLFRAPKPKNLPKARLQYVLFIVWRCLKCIRSFRFRSVYILLNYCDVRWLHPQKVTFNVGEVFWCHLLLFVLLLLLLFPCQNMYTRMHKPNLRGVSQRWRWRTRHAFSLVAECCASGVTVLWPGWWQVVASTRKYEKVCCGDDMVCLNIYMVDYELTVGTFISLVVLP